MYLYKFTKCELKFSWFCFSVLSLLKIQSCTREDEIFQGQMETSIDELYFLKETIPFNLSSYTIVFVTK